jgi:uncharacterized protein YkwD
MFSCLVNWQRALGPNILFRMLVYLTQSWLLAHCAGMILMLRNIPLFVSAPVRKVAMFALVTASILAGLLLFQPSNVAAFTGCTVEQAPVVNADFEAQVVQLVNAERAKQSLPPLKVLSSLTAAARHHAMDMAVDNYFGHDSMDSAGGQLTFACGTFDRISLWYKGWNRAAENIAAGFNSPQQVMDAWMKSDGHRDNILNPDYTEFGVGYYSGSGQFPAYWVQDFGARNGVTPLILAGEAATTTTRDLNVYVHGSWSQMRLRNDNGDWSEWQPFDNSFTWTIGDGRGEHYVAAELRSGGTTRSSCDAITLDVPAVAAGMVSAPKKLYLPAVQSGPPPVCE